MPELPEVETTRRGIEPHIIQQQFSRAIVRQRQLRWPVPATLSKQLIGQTILAVKRRAKYLLIECNNGTLIIHLGMSGRLCLVDKTTSVNKHDHLDLEFTNNKILRFTDPRRFGSVLWTNQDPTQHKLLAKLGVEPLTAQFSVKFLFAASRSKTVAVKTFLMDASIVVGIGNIYANEALYYANINPLRPAKSLLLAECKILVTQIKKILQRAIRCGGTTLKDFVGSDSKPGYFQQTLAVYGRGGAACNGCSQPLLELRQNQRTTVYCQTCQR